MINRKNQREDTILSVCHVATDVHGENYKQTLVSTSIQSFMHKNHMYSSIMLRIRLVFRPTESGTLTVDK